MRATPKLNEHDGHGQESAEDWPNASHCPCVGVHGPYVQLACSLAGCRYCKISVKKLRKAGSL
jgi:hypothetical protein